MDGFSNKKYAQEPIFMVVEDNDLLRQLMIERLEMMFEGCSLLEAGSGEEAVSMALAREPDIVLMDIGLPQMNGIEATRRIKAALPNVTIIIVSSYDDAIYRAKAEAAGASEYVTKSVRVSKLISTIEAFLPESRPS